MACFFIGQKGNFCGVLRRLTNRIELLQEHGELDFRPYISIKKKMIPYTRISYELLDFIGTSGLK